MGNAVAALPSVVDILNHSRPKSARLVPPWPPDPPLVPGHVNVTVPPGPTPAVVIVPAPRFIVPARSIHDSAILFISSQVTGRVPHLHFVVRCVINTNESRVINR